MIATIAILPGMMIGAFTGCLAGRLTTYRLPVLLVVALASVALLGMWPDCERYIVLAWIPTVVATLILERSTRPPPPDLAPASVLR